MQGGGIHASAGEECLPLIHSVMSLDRCLLREFGGWHQRHLDVGACIDGTMSSRK